MTFAHLAEWVPIRFYWRHEQPLLDWCYLGERRLSEPFFDQTIDACFKHPFNLLFRHQTSIDVLEELARDDPGLPPAGFIFHMSRCGSTLISQMLAALPQHIVVSEAGPIDGVLRANLRDSSISDEQRITWLRWIISAFGRRRFAQEQHLLIKFDCWHILDLALIRRAFPDVPWIFVYRDPVEVMVSHQRLPGSQMLPGLIDPRVFGFDPTTIFQVPRTEYCARVLARICEAAVEHCRQDAGIVIPYRRLPEAVWETLCAFFQIEQTPADRDQMRRVAQFHAKSPKIRFEADSQTKWREASEEIRQMAERWVQPWHEHLEALYQQQTAT